MAETPAVPAEPVPKKVAAAGVVRPTDPLAGQRADRPGTRPPAQVPGPTGFPVTPPVAEVESREEIAATNATLDLIEAQNIGGGVTDRAVLAQGTGAAQAAAASAGGGVAQRTRTRPAVGAGGLNRALDVYGEAIAAQQQVRAANLGIQMDFAEEFALRQQNEIFPRLQKANEILDSAEGQIAGIQEMMDDVLANRINPGQFFANIGDSGTFAASMAIAAGSLAAALGGGPNVALGIVNGAIARNMRAQALNQAHDRAVLTSKIQIFEQMRALGIDRLTQTKVYAAMLQSWAQTTLMGLAAASASSELQAMIPVLLADLGLKKEQNLIDAGGSIVSMTQMKLASEASDAQQQAQELVFAEAEFEINKVISGPAFAELSPEEQTAALTNAAQTVATKRRTAFSPDQLNALMQGTVTGVGPEGTPVDVPILRGVESGQLQPVEEGEDLVVAKPGGRKVSFLTTAEFKTQLDSKEQNELRKMFRASNLVVDDWQTIARLAAQGNVTIGGGMLDFLSRSSDGTWFASDKAPPEAQELRNALNALVVNTKIMFSGRLEAMRGEKEVEVWKAMQALIPKTKFELIAFFRGNNLSNVIMPTFKRAVDTQWKQFTPFVHDIPTWKEVKQP